MAIGPKVDVLREGITRTYAPARFDSASTRRLTAPSSHPVVVALKAKHSDQTDMSPTGPLRQILQREQMLAFRVTTEVPRKAKIRCS